MMPSQPLLSRPARVSLAVVLPPLLERLLINAALDRHIHPAIVLLALEGMGLLLFASSWKGRSRIVAAVVYAPIMFVILLIVIGTMVAA